MTWRYDKIKAANSTNTAHAIGNVYHDAIAPTTASVIKICSDHRLLMTMHPKKVLLKP